MSFSILLAGKKSADSQLAGNFPTNVAGKWNFSYHPAGSAEQIFFSQQQKKNTKKALKAFTYHCYGLYVAFCENVSLGAPEARNSVRQSTKKRHCLHRVVLDDLFSINLLPGFLLYSICDLT